MQFFRRNAYQIFKYLVYFAVLANVFLFLQKELNAAVHRFGDEIALSQIFEAFTATLDTAAWVVLLFLFELQTYVLREEKITKYFKWLLTGIRGLCFIMIFSSFFGYVKSYNWLNSFEKTPLNELCKVAGQSWMQELDEFLIIEKEQCQSLSKGAHFFKHTSKSVYTDDYYLQETRWLAGTNVLNSLSWILIVILLEIDVWLKNGYALKKTIVLNHYLKNACYFCLFICAIYWGVYGDFLEFWDAFLWIVAFAFIELNLLNWGKVGQADKQ